jgi:hypothetical protein
MVGRACLIVGFSQKAFNTFLPFFLLEGSFVAAADGAIKKVNGGGMGEWARNEMERNWRRGKEEGYWGECFGSFHSRSRRKEEGGGRMERREEEGGGTADWLLPKSGMGQDCEGRRSCCCFGGVENDEWEWEKKKRMKGHKEEEEEELAYCQKEDWKTQKDISRMRE